MLGDLLKGTDQKWSEEKLSQTMRTLIWLYRNSKFNLPQPPHIKELMAVVEEMDPKKAMSELEISRAILKDPSKMEKFIVYFKKDTLLTEEVLDSYARSWYELFRKVLISTDPAAWDATEFQGQQIASVISLKQAEGLFKKVRGIAEGDPTCPFILKKLILQFLTTPSEPKTPTEEDEATAEEIIGVLKPDLKNKDIEIYRALVDSLKWRGKKELTRTLAAVKKTPEERRKIRGRESCIFIESDEGVHYVG